MARYCSHTLILPDESRLDNMVVEVDGGGVIAYYPFSGEAHSTIYIDAPILLTPRADLEGKIVLLSQPGWVLDNNTHTSCLYAYRLTPCPICMDNHFVMVRL